MPTKSFDAPISTVSGHKASASPNDEVWGELVATNTEDIEGLEDNTLLSKLAQDCVSDLLQHDVNQLLNTLQPRERNVSSLRVPECPAPSMLVTASLKPLNDLHALYAGCSPFFNSRQQTAISCMCAEGRLANFVSALQSYQLVPAGGF